MSFYKGVKINASLKKNVASRSTYLNHFFEDWFEVLGTAKHERIYSHAQLVSWSAMGPLGGGAAVTHTGKFHFVFHRSLKEL
jgi:hypothetical protein